MELTDMQKAGQRMVISVIRRCQQLDATLGISSSLQTSTGSSGLQAKFCHITFHLRTLEVKMLGIEPWVVCLQTKVRSLPASSGTSLSYEQSIAFCIASLLARVQVGLSHHLPPEGLSWRCWESCTFQRG